MDSHDMTAGWYQTILNPSPFPEPINEDTDLCLPKEQEVPCNTKFGFIEKFYSAPFFGTARKILYE